MMFCVSACSTKAITVTNTGCSAFGVIYASRDDTDGTQRQIYAHNATYQELCLEKKNG